MSSSHDICDIANCVSCNCMSDRPTAQQTDRQADCPTDRPTAQARVQPTGGPQSTFCVSLHVGIHVYIYIMYIHIYIYVHLKVNL